MVDDSLIYSLAIGAAIGGFIYVGLSRKASDAPQRKSLAIASFGLGMAITWWLFNHSDEIENIMSEVVGKGVAILFAALAAALAFWRIRKFF